MKKDSFYIQNNKTYYKKEKGGQKIEFLEGVLKIIGCMETEQYWVCSCRGKNKNLQLETRVIKVAYDSFRETSKFSASLENSFNSSLGLDGKVTKSMLVEYQKYLKREYEKIGQVRIFKKPQLVGYIEKGYWFLNQETHVKDGQLLPPIDHDYIYDPNQKDEDKKQPANLHNLFLKLNDCLMKKETCIDVNKRDSYNGEANLLLLFGEKNVGKSLTQHIIHFGQGANESIHDLFISGGDSVNAGTSGVSIQDVSNKTSMLININDIKNSFNQAENLLQINEKLKQGSSKRGLKSSKCCGIIMSSNKEEKDRLEGRLLRLNYHRYQLDANSIQNLETLKETCQEFKGFLLAWVFHFGKDWQKCANNVKNIISEDIMKNASKKQQRWCEGVALISYTKYLYMKSIGKEISLRLHIEEFLRNNNEESVFRRIENNIRSKITLDQVPVLSWLNSTGNVKLLNGRRVRAIGIKVSCFTDEFLDVNLDEVKSALEMISDNAKCKAMYFCKEDTDGTLATLRKRGEETVQVRAHKFPIDQFSEEFKEWVEEGDFTAQVKPISSQIDTSLNFDGLLEVEELLSSFEFDRPELDEDDEIDADVNLLTPRKKQEVVLMSPKSKCKFMEGFRYGMKMEKEMPVARLFVNQTEKEQSDDLGDERGDTQKGNQRDEKEGDSDGSKSGEEDEGDREGNQRDEKEGDSDGSKSGEEDEGDREGNQRDEKEGDSDGSESGEEDEGDREGNQRDEREGDSDGSESGEEDEGDREGNQRDEREGDSDGSESGEEDGSGHRSDMQHYEIETGNKFEKTTKRRAQQSLFPDGVFGALACASTSVRQQNVAPIDQHRTRKRKNVSTKQRSQPVTKRRKRKREIQKSDDRMLRSKCTVMIVPASC